jgi:methyl-accepting chemotaxis protein
MTIRSKLYAAIAVTMAGLALTAGVGIWGMSRLSDRFDDVQRAGDARALALQVKFAVADFNGWQTAYGYDNGKSRPIFLSSVAGFRGTLARAKLELTRPLERSLLKEITGAFGDFMRLDRMAWAALQAGRTAQVRRIFLGPEIVNFRRAAAGAERLAQSEAERASAEERAFRDARKDALRFLIGASLVAAFLVAILLVTALDLARTAERALARPSSADNVETPGAAGLS